MKRNIIIYIVCIPLIALLFSTCKKDPELRMPDLMSGVLINAVIQPGTSNLFVFQNLATEKMGFTLDFRRDADNNIIDKSSEKAFKSLQVYVIYNGDLTKPYGNAITSVPADVSVTGSEIAAALGMPFDSLKGCDNFYFYYMITTKDGIEIKSDNASPQLNNWPGASFSQSYTIKGVYDVNKFLGAYSCNEPGYGDYNVNFTLVAGDTIENNNFWDSGWPVKYYFKPAVDSIYIIESTMVFPPEYTVTGKGSFDACTGNFFVRYVVTSGGSPVDKNTHTFTKQ
jgi:hypothetical protein